MFARFFLDLSKFVNFANFANPRSDNCKQDALARLQAQADRRSEKMQVVQDRIEGQRRDFLRWP